VVGYPQGRGEGPVQEKFGKELELRVNRERDNFNAASGFLSGKQDQTKVFQLG